MKSDPVLDKAAILAKRKHFDGAFKVLKDEEDRYNGSFKYNYLFGIISLHSGSFVEAHEYLQYAWRIKPKDINTMLALAVLFLRRSNTVKAVDYYLDVLEMQKNNKIAKNALQIIRKNSAPEALSEWMTPDRIEKLFPPIPVPLVNQRSILTAVFSLAAIIVITLGILFITKTISNPFKSRNARPTEEYVLSNQERKDSIETGGLYRYILTSSQAITIYERSLSLFTSYRDEAAKIGLNRLLESNAGEALKSKARLLLENTEVPGFDTFKRDDNPSYTNVKNEPAVYRNVHVIWRGMATNVELSEEKTTFDFLVGYDTRKTLEGIVPVTFDKPVSINTERPLEVLGKIAVAPSYTDITLEGVAIHQSGRLEN